MCTKLYARKSNLVIDCEHKEQQVGWITRLNLKSSIGKPSEPLTCSCCQGNLSAVRVANESPHLPTIQGKKRARRVSQDHRSCCKRATRSINRSSSSSGSKPSSTSTLRLSLNVDGVVCSDRDFNPGFEGLPHICKSISSFF